MIAEIGSSTSRVAGDGGYLFPRAERAAERAPAPAVPRREPVEEFVASAAFEARVREKAPAAGAPGNSGDSRASDAMERADPAGEPKDADAAEGELSEEEQQQVDALKARDSEVRAHEAAHLAAGGSLVRGGASYSYQQGPDGKQYAVGGEVGIDTSSVSDDPQATIRKMQQVRAAALAPASPSGTDRSVASKAAQTEMKARQQLAERAAKQYGAAGGEPAPGRTLEAHV